jgi:RNA-directed DNA polymerase
MEESYGEGVATHTGPESCAVDREVGGEALTGVRAGRVLSREIFGQLRGADAVVTGGRQHRSHRQREMREDPARSETPSTHGSTSHGNREIPQPPAARGAAGRIGKSKDARR